MRFTVIFLVLMLLGGCTTVAPEPEVVNCPEPKACPACEVLQCPDPEVQIVEKIVQVPTPVITTEPPSATTAGDMHLPIIGAVEWVDVEPAGLRMQARIDTGAETTSIHAEQVRLVEKEGKRYVRFSVPDPQSDELVPMELRLRRQVLIKQHSREPERRFVVRMWLTLGDMRSRVDVTLSDRQDFEFPLLVGRNFLVDAAIVDVSRRHTQAM
ncbi:RimK/LysX family protein [Halioglobus sp. HI00S01]|uniref:ATP-dependent zinc protease family protein n=1 Tax=Halioglobus sp. HI00S01 TaxID=1822214 RepID=UPI0009ED8901|nr:RimK/LysX family protein [Halioglobus sp. HI00S01]